MNSSLPLLRRTMLGATLALGFLAIQTTMTVPAHAQETTGALQGTIKDPSGAVIPHAKIALSSPNLAGGKSTASDEKGFYHFDNLPPGTYTESVEAQGFSSLKRQNIVIEVGHQPTLDLTMSVGSASSTVEVTSESPIVDVTTETTQTNITHDVVSYVPHGLSFQSVIQFAPSARNEPLQGNTALGNGSGGTSPGNGSNGNSIGYSIAGAADSENAYLVEGQETADVIGGYSHTNVPFDFIQEEEVKTSGVDAQYRGALGGVINVIMKKGSPRYHGSVFLQAETSGMDGSPTAYTRYDPQGSTTKLDNGFILDAPYQYYQPTRDKTGDFLPGFTFGGPLVPTSALRDKIFFFIGFNPEFHALERRVNFSGTEIPFSQNTQTYYTNARVDAAITQRVHAFASWLFQGQHQSGESMPFADSTTGLFDPSSANNPTNYSHTLGYNAPNITTNFGADVTISKSLVSTTRYGYFFENYRDHGYPTAGNTYVFEAAGLGEPNGFESQALDANFTHRNAEKHKQLDQDIAWYKSGWAGTHNFRFGYQFNQESDNIFQGYNAPEIVVEPNLPYAVATTTGEANCAAAIAAGAATAAKGGCQGAYGYEYAMDAGNGGVATSNNNAFYVQDAWTMGHGLTVNAGLRIEKEFLPAENQPNGAIVKSINFGWGDKVAPRVGAAWDVLQNGKIKAFGEYGVFTDIMKLNLAIGSFGGQYWNNCVYLMGSPDYTSLSVTPDATGRYCPSNGNPALVTGGTTASSLYYIENQNFRGWPTTCSTCSATAEGVAPGLKPYRQHESALGIDFQINPTFVLEARWDRRRLDDAIEDSSLFSPDAGGETFVIVNPGKGVDSTFNGFWNFLYGAPPPACSGDSCPPNGVIPAARSYDGLELRLTKSYSHHLYAMVSYTYSNFRGNYTGLTSSDLGDAGGGRNAPNNSRSFDEPFFQWSSHGTSSSGPLPTDRPNVLKGDAYYELPWGNGRLSHAVSGFGIFQTIYQGSPVTSYLDVGYAFPSGFPTFVEGRGKWVNVTQDPTTGAVTAGPATDRRTSPYTQTDFNFKQTFHVAETQEISFDATFTNLLNQRAVTAYNSQIDSGYTTTFVQPGGLDLTAGAPAYGAFMHPYDWRALMNTNQVTVNSGYGQPYLFQQPRSIRLQIHYNF